MQITGDYEERAEKRYYIGEAHLFTEPTRYGDILLVQIGRIHCTGSTVIERHLHKNWIELTVVTEGRGTVDTNGVSTPLESGDIHVSFPGDFHGITSDKKEPLKYDFFAFWTEEESLFLRLDEMTRVCLSEGQRVIRDARIAALVGNAVAEVNAPDEGSSELLTHIFAQIVLYLIRDVMQGHSEYQKTHVGTPNELCYRMMNYVDTHIYSMRHLSEMTEEMNYNYSYLSDLFRSVTGDTLQNYYRNRRLEAAKLLIRENELSMTEIAEMLQYSSVYTFSRAFRDRFGMPPSEYKKKSV